MLQFLSKLRDKLDKLYLTGFNTQILFLVYICLNLNVYERNDNIIEMNCIRFAISQRLNKRSTSPLILVKSLFKPRRKKTNILHMRKQDADKLRDNREELISAFIFRYLDSTIPLLSKYKISIL